MNNPISISSRKKKTKKPGTERENTGGARRKGTRACNVSKSPSLTHSHSLYLCLSVDQISNQPLFIACPLSTVHEYRSRGLLPFPPSRWIARAHMTHLVQCCVPPPLVRFVRPKARLSHTATHTQTNFPSYFFSLLQLLARLLLYNFSHPTLVSSIK